MNTIKNIIGNFLLLFVAKKQCPHENTVPRVFETHPLEWTPHEEKK